MFSQRYKILVNPCSSFSFYIFIFFSSFIFFFYRGFHSSLILFHFPLYSFPFFLPTILTLSIILSFLSAFLYIFFSYSFIRSVLFPSFFSSNLLSCFPSFFIYFSFILAFLHPSTCPLPPLFFLHSFGRLFLPFPSFFIH